MFILSSVLLLNLNSLLPCFNFLMYKKKIGKFYFYPNSITWRRYTMYIHATWSSNVILTFVSIFLCYFYIIINPYSLFTHEFRENSQFGLLSYFWHQVLQELASSYFSYLNLILLLSLK